MECLDNYTDFIFYRYLISVAAINSFTVLYALTTVLRKVTAGTQHEKPFRYVGVSILRICLWPAQHLLDKHTTSGKRNT